MNKLFSALMGSARQVPLWDAANEGKPGAGTDGGANGGNPAGVNDAGTQGNGGPRGDGTGATSDTTGDNGAGDPASWQYELNYPEAFALEGERLEEWTGLLREIGVTPEQASKIAEKEAAWYEATIAQTQQQLDAYGKAVEADKYLSADWAKTVQRMEAGLKAANVSQEFRDFLSSPEGAVISANPDILRAFAMLGQTTTNDKFETGQRTEDVVPVQRNWYKDTTPETKRG